MDVADLGFGISSDVGGRRALHSQETLCITSQRLFLLYSIRFSWSLRQFLSFVKVTYMLAFFTGHTGPSRKENSCYVHCHNHRSKFVVRGIIGLSTFRGIQAAPCFL